MRNSIKSSRWLALVSLIAITVSFNFGGHASAQAGSRYFGETGHTVTEPFLTYWNTHGALAQQGYPITDDYQEVNDADGHTYRTQYFERSRFEYHPEQTDPQYQVLLGLLGTEAFKAKYPGGLPSGTPSQIVPGGGSFLFTQTGHTVTGLFLSYWQSHGGLAQQGLPITEAYMERNDADGNLYITQYFERARFEYHPEQSDPQYRVLLGLVGKEVYQRKHNGSHPTPTATPTPTHFYDGFDAVLVYPNNKAYFFKGSQYVRYDIATSHVDPGYPQPIAPNWKGVFADGIDAAVVWPTNNKVYFFKGNQYVRYDIATSQADPGYPQPIGPNWRGVFPDGIDAVVVWPTNNKAYFFKGSQYIRYDIATSQADPGYPQPIGPNWRGVFPSGIDDVAVWPTNNKSKAYFFKGSQYVRYDVATSQVDPGYPQPILGNWPGMP